MRDGWVKVRCRALSWRAIADGVRVCDLGKTMKKWGGLDGTGTWVLGTGFCVRDGPGLAMFVVGNVYIPVQLIPI